MIDRLNTALEGRYTLERELGTGGMATVYLAHDVKHDRKVAIKVLKPELAAMIGGERFVAEIRTTAGLQHPHILPLFDSGEASGFLYYVMPYVEGESLRDRLDREKQLGVDDALAVTRDVADALDYAHRRGVIHRDIKPENILLHDGRPVVADFGIAIAISAAGGGRMTETGLSLGTPHYMSPEQATADRDLTVRSDVYSLACVLYEMLAGDPPHTGPTAQAVLVRILTETPRPVSDTRSAVPPHVAAVLTKALEKLPADRFESAAEFKDALGRTDFTYTAVRRGPRAGDAASATAESTLASGAVTSATRVRRLAPWMAAATAVLLAAWGWLRPEPASPTTVLFLDTGELTVHPRHPILISPDGRTFAIVADTTATGEPGRLFVRRIDEERFRLATADVDVDEPAFSPDGQWLVYSHEGALKRVSIDGGQPNTLFQRAGFPAYEVSWGDNGYLYFYGDPQRAEEGVYRIAETGAGEPELLVEGSWMWFATPLPGGRGVLMVDERSGPALVLYDVEADTLRTLLPEAAWGTFVETGHIVYGHPAGGLQAVAFDLKRMEVTGSPVPVRDGVSVRDEQAFFSISTAGTLTYIAGRNSGSGTLDQLVEYDLATGSTADVRLPPEDVTDIEYSPNGRWLAMAKGEEGATWQVFIYDLELGTSPRQLTFDGVNVDPTWSPDGTRLAWVKAEGDSTGVWIRTVAEDAPATRISSSDPQRSDLEWRTDTRIIHEVDAGSTSDLGVLDPSDGAAAIYLPSVYDLDDPTVSPAGDFIAYVSDELGGVDEIFVRSFPEPGQPTRISVGGGLQPRWSPDGRGIYFWPPGDPGPQRSLKLAHLRTEPVVTVDSTTTVISEGARYATLFDVHPSGDRLMLLRSGGAQPAPDSTVAEPERYVVVLNWFEELRERSGGGR